MPEFTALFSPMEFAGLKLKNRIAMTPLYLGYAGSDGGVTPLVLDHYREMAGSGAAMVAVEHIAVDPAGLGSPFMLRADDDRFLAGLSNLARTIRAEGAVAFAQLNHTGRYAFLPERWAPSPVESGGVVPRAMDHAEIDRTVKSYAAAARRIRHAGFDGLEIHGGTGYLLVQFLSGRTNLRTDEYGGPLENRFRFPLRVFDAVKQAVGAGYPVGYRFLADELLPDGLKLEETVPFAQILAERGVAYLSVMAGTHESFRLPEVIEMEHHEGYMVAYAEAVKKACTQTPVITAGRIQTPEFADRIVAESRADVVGLARVLFTDPLWPKKAKGEVSAPFVKCEPTCSLCSKRIMTGRPAMCSQWNKARRQAFLERVGEAVIGDEG